MKIKEWFHAQIRWAVLVEGKKGLRSWEEAAYIFLSENHERAFEQALVMGRRHENIRKEGTSIGFNQTGGNRHPGLLWSESV